MLSHDKGPIVSVLAPRNECGYVFAVRVDEPFTVDSLGAIDCGQHGDGAAEDPSQGSVERIANPRALTYVNAFIYLLIIEDNHKEGENTIWVWDPQNRRITRILVVGGNNHAIKCVRIAISKSLDIFRWLSYFASYSSTAPMNISPASISAPSAKSVKRLPTSFRRATRGEIEHYRPFKDFFRTGPELSWTGSDSSTILQGKVVSMEYEAVYGYA